MTQAQFEAVKDLALKLEGLQTDVNQRLWAQYTTGFDFDLEGAQAKVRAEYQRPESFALLQRCLELDLNQADRRRLEILIRDFQPYHRSAKANLIREKIDTLETRLGELLSKFRVVLEGKEISSQEIKRILAEEPDRSLRRKAYLARNQVNPALVDAGFLELLQLRKDFASACGSSDFVGHSLEQDDLEPGMMLPWRDEAKLFATAYRHKINRLAQQNLSLEQCEPWDIEFLKARICPLNSSLVDIAEYRRVLAQVFHDFGFILEGLPITYDIFPRSNKSEWGYMFPIQIGRDARILANMDNRFSSYWTLLHETAHAVHFLGLDPEDRLLNRGLSSVVAEGFANFFGDLSYSREFLSQFFSEQIDQALEGFSKMNELAELENVALLSRALFDQALYNEDVRSLSQVNELKQRYDQELLKATPEREAPPWGYIIHHTVAPVYLHTYFLGDIFNEMLKAEFFRRTQQPWSKSPKGFGALWRNEVLSPSGLYPMAELCRRVTGKNLTIKPYLERITQIDQSRH